MKLWLIFVIGAILSWGSYVPLMHEGQGQLKGGALRAFLCVGMAYFLVAVLAPLGLMAGPKLEPWQFTKGGVTYATIAGMAGAMGALCVILALKSGGTPIYVAPLVFAGAPIVATVISILWHQPKSWPSPLFFLGMVMAATGAAMVLRFKPS
jgi:uncharacterized membrane protein